MKTLQPSQSYMPFRLKLISNYEGEINLRVIDGTGRIVEHRQNLRSGQTVEMGSVYVQGIYFADFIQGGQRKVVKLIKQ